MEVVGSAGGVNERLHERFHYLVTAQFHVEHGLAVVYFLYAELLTAAICVAHLWRDVVYETSLERAVEHLLLVVGEGANTLVLQFANDTRPHIHYLFVLVAHSFVTGALSNVAPRLLVEER